MGKQKMYLDIETDFKKRLLSVGVTSENGKIKEEYFIYQNEENLYYPEGVDQKYVKILAQWRTKEKTPIKVVLERIKELAENYKFVGWNIKSFDLPIFQRYFKIYNLGDFFPDAFDGYLALRRLVKNHKIVDKKMLDFNGGQTKGKLTAENVFRYLTGCEGYVENHTALFDAQDERLIIKLLTRRYGKEFLALG